MKNLIVRLRFYSMFVMSALISSSAFASEGGRSSAVQSVLDLIESLKPIFEVLSILAFVGAGFIIAGWAWGFIAAGEVKFDDVKKKGIGMIIGFILLFAIGAILQFLLGVAAPDSTTLNAGEVAEAFNF